MSAEKAKAFHTALKNWSQASATEAFRSNGLTEAYTKTFSKLLADTAPALQVEQWQKLPPVFRYQIKPDGTAQKT